MKRRIKTVAVMAMVMVMMLTQCEKVFAYEARLTRDMRAGSTWGDATLYMDNTYAYAALDTNDYSELYIEGYVKDRILDITHRYSFMAGDQWGSSISAGRYTAFVTLESYAEYKVYSADGSATDTMTLHQ